jgi:hypothetical protein
MVGNKEWGPYWQIVEFFSVPGEEIKVKLKPESLSGTDESGKPFTKEIHPGKTVKYKPSVAAVTHEHFEQIYARELIRSGIDDPSLNRSETVNRLSSLMKDFTGILEQEFPGIKRQDPACLEMRNTVQLFNQFVQAHGNMILASEVIGENRIANKGSKRLVNNSIILARKLLYYFDKTERELLGEETYREIIPQYGFNADSVIKTAKSKTLPSLVELKEILNDWSGKNERIKRGDILSWLTGAKEILQKFHPQAEEAIDFCVFGINKVKNGR